MADNSAEQTAGFYFLKIIFSHIIDYISTAFLLLVIFSVLLGISLLILAPLTVIDQEIQIKLFSFLGPGNFSYEGSLDPSILLDIYFLLTSVIFLISKAWRTVARSVFKKEIKEEGYRLGKRIITAAVVIHTVFLLDLLIIPLLKTSDLGGLYSVLLIFYVQAVIGAGVYLLLSHFAIRMRSDAVAKMKALAPEINEKYKQ